jgi:hypothetical protein
MENASFNAPRYQLELRLGVLSRQVRDSRGCEKGEPPVPVEMSKSPSIDTARKEPPGSTTGRRDPAPARGRPAPGVKPLIIKDLLRKQADLLRKQARGRSGSSTTRRVPPRVACPIHLSRPGPAGRFTSSSSDRLVPLSVRPWRHVAEAGARWVRLPSWAVTYLPLYLLRTFALSSSHGATCKTGVVTFDELLASGMDRGQL